MELIKTIMEQHRDDYFDSFGKKYENHVNKFIEYLRSVKKLNMPLKVDLSDVKNCIKYYSDIGKINYRASMESHLESVKSFYDYLTEKGKTADIFTQIKYENYKNEIFEYCNLEEGSEREIFSSEIIKEILAKLDKDLEKSPEQVEGKRETERYYQRQILRLFIKLTLIAPAKKGVICNLKFSNFDTEFRTLVVNQTNIRVPNGLRRDLQTAIKYAKKLHKNVPTNSDKLLKYISKSKFANEALNQWFCTFLKQYDVLDIDNNKYTYQLEPIMKGAISLMVKRMVSPAVISKISGIKIASLENTYYSDFENFHRDENIDDIINWEIAKNDYYNYI